MSNIQSMNLACAAIAIYCNLILSSACSLIHGINMISNIILFYTQRVEYLVQWEGDYTPSWEPSQHLNTEALASYCCQPTADDIEDASKVWCYEIQRKLHAKPL